MSFIQDTYIQSRRIVQDVDKIPDSDTREEDLIELIDFKNTPSYGLFRVMEDLV
jgi:hypothetical protein